LARGCRPRYVPPAGFGYPLGGLLPPRPCRSYFVPAALLGFRPSELPPPGRYPPRFRGEGPTYRFSRRFLPALLRWAGPTGRGFWAFTLPGVPGDRHRISAAGAGCSLGLHPLRAFSRGVARDFARTPPTRFAEADLATGTAGASEYRTAAALPRPGSGEPATGQGNPYRVPAPDYTRKRSSDPPSGLLGSPCVAPCITADSRRALDGLNRPAGAARVQPWVPLWHFLFIPAQAGISFSL
jgi:hypothetical protein